MFVVFRSSCLKECVVYKYLNFELRSELFLEIHALLISRYYDVDDVYYYKILHFSVVVSGDINIYFLTCILKSILNDYMNIALCIVCLLFEIVYIRLT